MLEFPKSKHRIDKFTLFFMILKVIPLFSSSSSISVGSSANTSIPAEHEYCY